MAEVTADEFRSTMRAIAWERAKGALRELVAIKGAIPSDGRLHRHGLMEFEDLEKEVNEFIEHIEANGMHE